jgi:hypothetical protein
MPFKTFLVKVEMVSVCDNLGKLGISVPKNMGIDFDNERVFQVFQSMCEYYCISGQVSDAKILANFKN